MSYQRIACLSTEAVETLYALGAEDRIAGISGFTVYPPRARQEKPKISGFSSSKLERILAVEPDLVIAFSDLQADIARDLVREGVEVHVFNHRDVAGILRMVATLGALVDKAAEAKTIVRDLSERIEKARAAAASLARSPRVYFEEWHDPMIAGIGWVSELIGIAGGIDVFADRARAHGAKQRVVSAEEVLERAPEIIIGSWCGKKFVPDHVRARAGWEALPAVRDNELHEIKSADILAPGAVAVTLGLTQLTTLFQDWAARQAG